MASPAGIRVRYRARRDRPETLHANPGRHGEVPAFKLDSALRFFARHLG